MLNYREIIDQRIGEKLSAEKFNDSKAVAAARYSIMNAGKRIRPIILLEFAKLFGANVNNVLDMAVALEMIHTYSLIHDDLPCMDNDDMRRGKPSCHIEFGEDTALLAGDTLLTEAFFVAANAELDANKKVKCIEILSKRAGARGMIDGQVMDLSFENYVPNADDLQEMCIKKTADLISAACEIGAVIGGADDDTLIKVREFAVNLGLAFQIIDDILDVTSTSDVLGKPIGSDEANRKTTFVSLYGLNGAQIVATEQTEKAMRILESLDGDTEFLKSLTNYLLKRNF